MEVLQLQLLLLCTDISEQNQAVTRDTCFSLLLSPTTNSCRSFYICSLPVFSSSFAAVVQAGVLRRRGLSGRLQVLHHLPGRHPDFHQVVPAHGRVRALGQRQTLLHPYHQQVWDLCNEGTCDGATQHTVGQLHSNLQWVRFIVGEEQTSISQHLNKQKYQHSQSSIQLFSIFLYKQAN